MADTSRREPVAVSLVPMSRAIYEAWRDHSVREYAVEHVAAGNWPADGALERARSQLEELLPAGLETPGQTLWSVEDSSGRHVGMLWVGPRPGVPESLWIWDIAIEPGDRGRGYGQAALAALDAWARERGYARVGLHVFGANLVARRLYERTGYAITDLVMEKTL